jgi:hypothetical protein
MIYVSMRGEYYWTNNGGSKIKVGAHYDSYIREYSCIHGRQNLV